MYPYFNIKAILNIEWMVFYFEHDNIQTLEISQLPIYDQINDKLSSVLN